MSEGRSIEWPTIALAVGLYGGWGALTFWWTALPLWLVLPCLAWVLCWHSSLQHEIIHGHPTRHESVNWALGYPPLLLWLPFEQYRSSHLTHHRDHRLTDPLDDPESRYVTPDQWAAFNLLERAALIAQSRLIGRLLIGPIWLIPRYLISELRQILRGDDGVRRIWGWHLLGVGLVCLWLDVICQIPIWLYLVGAVLPATSLMLIRSFAEHRAAEDVGHRTAIVEDFGPLAWLFLFNNLHVAHHAKPSLAWYQLPGYYRQHKADLLKRNGNLLYQGYGAVFRRFLVRPHALPVHPMGRV